jgi:hypothetical protein
MSKLLTLIILLFLSELNGQLGQSQFGQQGLGQQGFR